MAGFFDASYYLKSKLAQLKSVGEKDANGNEYTMTTLQEAIANAGMTPETHYQSFGRTEKLNPNAYFNESEYLQAKLNQLKSVGEKDANGNDYTLETLVKAIDNIGMSVAEHYETFGSHETDASGNLINPSNAFDANAYVAAKLAELVKTEPENWTGKTAADVIAVMTEVGLSPVTHYEMHGATEANATGVPLVQTVPVTQRVTNDPARAEVTGELVPSNYNAPTPPPSAVTAETAAPVTKPADMGALANTTVSPEVQVPTTAVPVPGDTGYVAPPANIVDTNDKPVVVVPPATEGGKPQFGVVTGGGTIIGVDNNGNTTGDVIGKVDGDSGTVKPVEPVTPTPEPTPDPGPAPDTTPPTAPTFAEKIAGDNVIDRHELLSGVALTGTAEAGSTVKITVTDSADAAHSVTLSGKADANGKYSLTLKQTDAANLKDGTLTLTATATDASSNTSSVSTKELTLDAALDATYTATTPADGETQLGLTAPKGFAGSTPTLDQLMTELQAVYDKVNPNGTGDYTALDTLTTDAPNFAKLVQFYKTGEHTIDQTVIAPATGTTKELNLSAHDVYGGGLSLSLENLNSAPAGGRVAALTYILGKADFDLPVIQAKATDVVNLEVNKVGSTITEAIDSSLWHNDITFAKLVGMIPEVKPIAVEADTKTLDLRLAADATEEDAKVVNLMEVRGTVENITFSGTEGRFGINVDTASVKNIDASSLGEDSGVYVNTAEIGVTIPLSSTEQDKVASMGFHADVANGLSFTGSTGNDLLVMTQEKYSAAAKLDGGAGADTLALLGTSEDPSTAITVTSSNKLTGFEKLALVDISNTSSVEGSFKIEDASSFTGIKEFITTNSLTIGGLASGTEISVVNFMAFNVNLDLAAATAGSSVTLNVAMTDHFLMHPEVLLGNTVLEGTQSRAVLTNANNITNLTLTGKDANATILLTTDALTDLQGATIDVTGYVGDIQYEKGWTYGGSAHTLTKDGTTVTLSGVNTTTDFSAVSLD